MDESSDICIVVYFHKNIISSVRTGQLHEAVNVDLGLFVDGLPFKSNANAWENYVCA